jgi:type IV secretory pathway TraG/TraD family ATPase VirD4
VIGQTGTGKSSSFQSMIRQDLKNGKGICVIDPHGSLVESVLPFVPKSRIDDVIIFDPSDTERPMGLNLLEASSPEEMDMVALDAMNIMLKIFDEEVFGPRLQDYFRNGVLTLMSDPNGGALTDIMRLFTDDAFQRAKVKHVTNPVVKNFWTNQMAKTGAREKQEIIPYFAAKFGQFTTNGMLRNIIGQTKSAFDFSEVMDDGKILLMNLSKGSTGEINSKLLGLIIVSKLQTAALRRQKKLSQGTAPRDFFMYIDEFQNYVTDSIESILSEARKYKLSLNIAHQFIAQLDEKIRDSVFGNVGSMSAFRVGAEDGEFLQKQLTPVFNADDLINIDNFQCCTKLLINNKSSDPFNMKTYPPESGSVELRDAFKEYSRYTYGRDRDLIENEIKNRYNQAVSNN